MITQRISQISIVSSFCYLFFVSCGPTGQERAQFEQDYVTAKYKDKMDRPSPPARAEAKVGTTVISIDYSQPGVKGRSIWGKLVKYDKMWRTGANEATVLEVTEPVVISGKTIKAGKYSLFTIPSETEWTIVVNNVFDQWGTYDYKETEDAVRFNVKPYTVDELQERMTFHVDNQGTVSFSWAHLRFDFPIDPVNP